MYGAPRESIQWTAFISGSAVAIDRHRHRPLTGATDGHDLIAIDLRTFESGPHGLIDGPPPVGGILLGPAAGSEQGQNRFAGMREDAARLGHDGDLRSAAPQINRQHAAFVVH